MMPKRAPFLTLAAFAALAALAALAACPKKKQPEVTSPAAAPSSAPASAPAAMKIPKDATRVVSTTPPNGAKDVPISLEVISVVFNRPMSRTSVGFVMESDQTALAATGRASFDDMGRMVSLPVKLELGRDYVVWINREEQLGFKDISGKPAAPFRLSFSTAGSPKPGSAAGKVLVDGKLAQAMAAPRVVATDPPSGARDVDPARTSISVTFDQPMKRDRWSWVKQPDQPFPDGLGQPSFDVSGRINTVPVKLKPKTSYLIWINSEKFKNFQGEQGAPAAPYKLTFTTR
jgi:hypothetical protein